MDIYFPLMLRVIVPEQCDFKARLYNVHLKGSRVGKQCNATESPERNKLVLVTDGRQVVMVGA